jgi:hypothetical protein
LQISETLEAKGVNLKVLEQPIDTTTAAGRLFFTILGSFSEFEASIRSERQREGIDAALPGSGSRLTVHQKEVAIVSWQTQSGCRHEQAWELS